MVVAKTKRISTLIETQLPEFISTEYELFTKFIEKYYEAQEVQGGTLDVISNLQDYADICLLYTSPSPRDNRVSRMPSSA